MLTHKARLPWSMAFLPGGKILVDEKGGTIRIPHVGGALPQPTRQSHPAIVVARARLDEPARAMRDAAVIVRAKPNLPRNRSANTGGRIAIDRDGNLFVTIGDPSGTPPWTMAQKLDNHLGKMIHITPEGAPAPNNPFLHTPGALPEIWSYGHRSEQGLTINPATYWDPVIAPSGLTFYNVDLFPARKGSLFKPLLKELHARFRDVRVGPERGVRAHRQRRAAETHAQIRWESK